MKQIAVWLDLEEAFIIDFNADKSNVSHIQSEIEHYALKGGSRSKSPYGPMDKTSESKLLNRKKMQTKSYFKNLYDTIKVGDELLLMGPAEIKNHFAKYLNDLSVKCPQIVDVLTVDSITLNQKVAQARDYFDLRNKKRRIKF